MKNTILKLLDYETVIMDALEEAQPKYSREKMIDEGMHTLLKALNRLEFAHVYTGSVREKYEDIEADYKELERLRSLR